MSEFLRAALIGAGVWGSCALIVLTAEAFYRRDVSIYRTRAALNDLAYAIFYQCSVYSLVVMPLFIVLVPRLGFLRIGLLLNLHPIVATALLFVIFDLLNYGVHRLQHSVKVLWAFHSVHHAPEQLTFLSANRIHFVEQLWAGLAMMAPAFLLGVPQQRWLPLFFAQLLLETLQHARLDWSFGPLHRAVVSPAFHAVHHSADPRHHNANYGRVFAWWDVLFGTIVAAKERATRFGVDGMRIPERLTAQFAHPFRWLAGSVMLREDQRRVRAAEAE